MPFSVGWGSTRRGDPFTPHARAAFRFTQGGPQPDDLERKHQIAQVGFVAIVMRQKAIIHIVYFWTFIDKGVGFNLGNLPGSDLAAQQLIVEGVRAREVKQEQPPGLSTRLTSPSVRMIASRR